MKKVSKYINLITPSNLSKTILCILITCILSAVIKIAFNFNVVFMVVIALIVQSLLPLITTSMGSNPEQEANYLIAIPSRVICGICTWQVCYWLEYYRVSFSTTNRDFGISAYSVLYTLLLIVLCYIIGAVSTNLIFSTLSAENLSKNNIVFNVIFIVSSCILSVYLLLSLNFNNSIQFAVVYVVLFVINWLSAYFRPSKNKIAFVYLALGIVFPLVLGVFLFDKIDSQNLTLKTVMYFILLVSQYIITKYVDYVSSIYFSDYTEESNKHKMILKYLKDDDLCDEEEKVRTKEIAKEKHAIKRCKTNIKKTSNVVTLRLIVLICCILLISPVSKQTNSSADSDTNVPAQSNNVDTSNMVELPLSDTLDTNSISEYFTNTKYSSESINTSWFYYNIDSPTWAEYSAIPNYVTACEHSINNPTLILKDEVKREVFPTSEWVDALDYYVKDYQYIKPTNIATTDDIDTLKSYSFSSSGVAEFVNKLFSIVGSNFSNSVFNSVNLTSDMVQYIESDNLYYCYIGFLQDNRAYTFAMYFWSDSSSEYIRRFNYDCTVIDDIVSNQSDTVSQVATNNFIDINKAITSLNQTIDMYCYNTLYFGDIDLNSYVSDSKLVFPIENSSANMEFKISYVEGNVARPNGELMYRISYVVN